MAPVRAIDVDEQTDCLPCVCDGPTGRVCRRANSLSCRRGSIRASGVSLASNSLARERQWMAVNSEVVIHVVADLLRRTGDRLAVVRASIVCVLTDFLLRDVVLCRRVTCETKECDNGNDKYRYPGYLHHYLHQRPNVLL